MANPQSTSQGSFQAEVNSRFEPILIARVMEPLLALIPRSVLPNSISVVGHIACWSVLVLATLSSSLAPAWRALALVGCGILTFVGMTADCLDGMQARRTDRCGPTGELVDHWLDAVHVPLVTAGIGMALGLDPLLLVIVHTTNTTIYNAQLVLYHRSGRFVHTPTSGVDAQFGTSFGYLALALYLSVWGPNRWINLMLAAVATYTQLKLNWFYLKRLGRHATGCLPFVLLLAGYSAVFLAGGFSSLAYVLLLTLLSLRVTGAFVIHKLLDRPYGGVDPGTIVAGAVLTVVALVAPAQRETAAFCVLGYLALHSVLDFTRTYFTLLRRMQMQGR